MFEYRRVPQRIVEVPDRKSRYLHSTIRKGLMSACGGVRMGSHDVEVKMGE